MIKVLCTVKLPVRLDIIRYRLSHHKGDVVGDKESYIKPKWLAVSYKCRENILKIN